MPRRKKISTPENPGTPTAPKPSVYDVPLDFTLIDYIVERDSMERFPATSDGELKARAVSLRSAGWTSIQIADGLGIPRTLLEIWEQKDLLYKACIEFIRQVETKDVEQVVWENARHNRNASVERMFAVRARLPEYRDNAQMPAPVLTQVVISIEGQNLADAIADRLLESGDQQDSL